LNTTDFSKGSSKLLVKQTTESDENDEELLEKSKTTHGGDVSVSKTNRDLLNQS
jgi:hypothetical protein